MYGHSLITKRKHKIFFVAILIIIGFLPLIFMLITSLNSSKVHADANVYLEKPLAISVSSSCSMSATTSSPHSATLINGTSQSDIGLTSIKTICNDPYGYYVNAVGYNKDTTAEGDTKLHNDTYSSEYIETGTATSGGTSAWAMKVSAVSGNFAPTITYASDYAAVPSTRTKVAHFTGVAEADEGSTINTTYRVYISPGQPAGTYNGGVKYTLFHPDNSPSGLGSITYLQDMSAAICNNSYLYEMANLVDRRDNKSYTVAKLADDNCWMVENLRYGGVDKDGEIQTNTPNDTDLASGTTFSLIGSTPSGTAYNAGTSWTNTNTRSEYYPDDSKTGDQYWGYYYNWYAAVAGTVSGSVQQNASYSICPRGWTLPENSTATDSKSYSNLLWRSSVIANISDNSAYATDGFTKLTSAPLSFLRAGGHDTSGTSVSYRGGHGIYWSRSSNSTTNAYNLYFNSSNVYPRNYHSKSYGFSVRCVAR